MHQLYNILNNRETNITPIVGVIKRRSSYLELGEQLDFDVAYNDDRFFPVNPVDLGSLIVLQNADEIYRGIVITENKNGRSPISYTSFDYGFYLNKSKEVYQFNGVAGEQAIKTMLSDYGVPVGQIDSLGIVVNKIYKDEISSTIKDILEQAKKETGITYLMEFRQGKFYVEKQTTRVIKASFNLAGTDYNIQDAISNPSRTRSIENMRNSIKITLEDDVITQVRDDSLIKKFGVLQEVTSIDGEDIARAKTIAANMLKDLGRISEDCSIDVPGDDRVRAGRVLEITEQVTGMSGLYLITDASHTIQNGIHKMNLGLGVA